MQLLQQLHDNYSPFTANEDERRHGLAGASG